MKFGKYLEENREIGWEENYVDYNYLKKVIKSLEVIQTSSSSSSSAPPPIDINTKTSLSISKSNNKITQESFYKLLEDEMKKIELFTQAIVRFFIFLTLFLSLFLD